MKIAVVSNGHIPSQWAHSINIVKHANAFSKLGHEIELLSVKRFKEDQLLKKISNIYSWYGIDILPIKYFKDNSIFYFKEKKFLKIILKLANLFLPKFFQQIVDPEKKISQYIRSKNFDLCFARTYNVVKYNIENKIPTILETHNSSPKNIKNLIELLNLSQSKYFLGLVTIHDKLKENFLKLGVPKEKLLVLEDAVDLEKFDLVSDNIEINRKKLSIPLNKTIVMYCGSLKAGKGINLILNSAKKLECKNDILFYIIGGDENDINYWKNFNGINYNNVIFKSFVEGFQVPQYLKSANILFMPYETKNNYNSVMDLETTSPIKLFEYMASKKPIITSNIETIKKVLKNRESGILVDGKFENVILDLLVDDKLCSKISSKAYQNVKNYTYNKRCTTILKAFHKN
tara:strand:+ start:717 stop:1925 length:1209 start_codon:yes stop_codon:yes gene_type:complete